MPRPTNDQKEALRQARAGPLDAPLRYMRRGERLLGLGLGTAVATSPIGTVGQFIPGIKDWLPDAEQMPEAAKQFWELSRQGDWDAAITAAQDEMDAGPGYWGLAELGASAVVPTGLPALAGRGLIKAAPKLAGTLSSIAPRAVRPGVQTGIASGLRGVGQVARAPWELEEAMGRGLIGGGRWLAGKAGIGGARAPTIADQVVADEAAARFAGQPGETTIEVGGAQATARGARAVEPPDDIMAGLDPAEETAAGATERRPRMTEREFQKIYGDDLAREAEEAASLPPIPTTPVGATVAGGRFKHFTTPGAKSQLEAGSPFDPTLLPQHGTGDLSIAAKTGKFAGNRLYLSLDDARWSQVGERRTTGGVVEATSENAGTGGARFYDYEKQKWMQSVDEDIVTTLHPVEFDISPNARVLEIDSYEAYGRARAKYGSLADESDWDEIARDYDAVAIRNRNRVLSQDDPVSRGDKFYRAIGGDQIIVLNPQVAKIVRPTTGRTAATAAPTTATPTTTTGAPVARGARAGAPDVGPTITIHIDPDPIEIPTIHQDISRKTGWIADQNPTNPKEFRFLDNNNNPLIIARLVWRNKDLEIDHVESLSRGQGNASKWLDAMTEYADENNITLRLDATPITTGMANMPVGQARGLELPDLTQQGLIEFYARHGFKFPTKARRAKDPSVVMSLDGKEVTSPKGVRVPAVAPTARVGAPVARGARAGDEGVGAVPEGVGTPTGRMPITRADEANTWQSAAQSSDPSPPSKGDPPTGIGGSADDADNALSDIRRLRTPGEAPAQTLLRRHEAALNAAEATVRNITEAGSSKLRALGIGAIRQGRLLARQEDIPSMDALFEALHNPSRVATGEIRVPARLQGIYDELRRLTDWEESMQVNFDPETALIDDYFSRGWKPPKELLQEGASRTGPLGRKPGFQKPRVNATYREMRDAGFEPLSWNPYEQWRISRQQRTRHRQQMQLIDDLKANGLAKTYTDVDGNLDYTDWRIPQVGPAFEGRRINITTAPGKTEPVYINKWAVPNNVANLLENLYGRKPTQGKVMKFIDWITFVPKRAKLFGSFFQQSDFLQRNFLGSWTGAVDALAAGRPIEAARRLAIWPKSAWDILQANFSPGARTRIRKELTGTKALIPGRPGIHLKGIVEAGLSTIDTSILPQNLDEMANAVATEAGLLGNKAVRRTILSLESSMRRGLFEGTYPAAQITDIRNNIAPMVVRWYGKGATDEAINGMIAQIANKKYSTIPATQSVLGSQRPIYRDILRRLFFSIGESEGLLRQATGVFKGHQKAYWATHWVGAYLGLIALAYTIHFASTGKPLPLKRYNPISTTDWGILPLGYNPEFASPDIPVRDTEGRRLTLDLAMQMDTAFRVLDPIGFISSRESVPVRAGQTLLAQRDYFGRPTDEVGPGGIFSTTANLMNDLFTPIGPGQAAVQIGLQKGILPEGLLPESERRLGTAGQLLQAPGMNIRAIEGYRTLAYDAVNDFKPAMTLSDDIPGYRGDARSFSDTLSYADLHKHPAVVQSIKNMLPEDLRDLADKYIHADRQGRRELEEGERGPDVRNIIAEAVRQSSRPGGKLFEAKGIFLAVAPNEWKMWASLLGVDFPGSEETKKALLDEIQASNGAISEEMPSPDPSQWPSVTPEPAGVR